MKKIILSLLTLLYFTGINAQQTSQSTILFQLDYLLYLPDGYEEGYDTKWPLVVFLHGAGETGSDLNKIKVHGIPRLVEEGKKFPFIAVSPQAPEYGWKPDIVKKLIQKVSEKYQVDENRIYLTGLSMGGFGTWETAISNPSLFAAIIPICGGGEPEDAWKLRNLPVWCFHGDADDVVDIMYSKKIMDALVPINPEAKFTVYPGVGHDSWTETYYNEEIFDWLLSHKRFQYTMVDLPIEELNEFAGIYKNKDNTEDNNMNLVTGDGVLHSMNGENVELTLKPAGNNRFFMSPEIFNSIEFVKDASGRISSFILEAEWGRKEFIRQ